MTDPTKPLLPDSPSARAVAGGTAASIVGLLGYIITAELDVGCELQQAIDQGVHYRTIIEQQVTDANHEREKLADRVRVLELELANRKDVAEGFRHEQIFMQEQLRRKLQEVGINANE